MAIERGATQSITGEWTAWVHDTESGWSAMSPGFDSYHDAIAWAESQIPPHSDGESQNAGCAGPVSAFVAGVVTVGLMTLPLWWA